MTSLSRNLKGRFSEGNATWKNDKTNIQSNLDKSDKLRLSNQSVPNQINKKLSFEVSDGYDEDDEEDQVELPNGMTRSNQVIVRSSDGPIRKRIDFGSSEDDVQNQDRDPSPIRNLEYDSDSEVDSENSYHAKKQAIVSSILKSRDASPPANVSESYKNSILHCHFIKPQHQTMQSGDHLPIHHGMSPSHEYEIVPSPHRTRSGRIYTSGDCQLSGSNSYCLECKQNTPSSTSFHHISPKHISYQTFQSMKRPFNDGDSPQLQSALENATETIYTEENIHLNLLQNDISSKETVKRSRRHSSGMSDSSNSNIHNEVQNQGNASEPSFTLAFDQDQPPFELPPPSLNEPPPLEYVKRPVSRLSLIREKLLHNKKGDNLKLRTDLKVRNIKSYDHDSHPLSRLKTPSFTGGNAMEVPEYIYQTPTNQHSPPVNEVRAMRIFDSPAPMKHRIAFDISETVAEGSKITGHQRRKSAPAGGPSLIETKASAITDHSQSEQAKRSRKRVANVNPFTPTPTLDSIKRKKHSEGSSIIQTPGNCSMYGDSFGGHRNISSHSNSVATPTDSTMNMDTHNSLNSSTEPGTNRTLPDVHTEKQATHAEFVFQQPYQPKRLRVSDINVSRYEEEFVELEEIASGVFGKVMVARHRLDGMVYAIKITKKQIYGNTHQERVTMNEVFAHSALIKHKHVVRYYNSWVENGRVYIQNEFCEGGALGSRIDDLRKENQATNTQKRFPECELKKILLHAAKGLQYIHSKGLVHLDVKPENIFITLEHTSNSPSPNTQEGCDDNGTNTTANATQKSDTISREPASVSQDSHRHSNMQIPNASNCLPQLRQRNRSGHESTDSGNGSGCDMSNIQVTGVVNHPQCNGVHREPSSSSPGTPDSAGCPYFNGADRVSYKLGDLGHVVPIRGDYNPEEGDCRYMAPELLSDDINRENLAKADVFSLGLAMYEAATLIKLPKNSLEDSSYENIKSGNIPQIAGYSKEFNSLIKSMIQPDPMLRPNASRLVTLVALRTNGANSKSRSQLYKELKEARSQLKLLEEKLENQKRTGINSQEASASPEFPTPPKDKETSALTLSPIIHTSAFNSNQVAPEENNDCKYVARSNDCLNMDTSDNTTSRGIISKTSSTPKRNEKRLNLRKRALAGRSKPGSPAPSKNGRHI